MLPEKKSFKKERFSHCQEKAVLLRTDNFAEEKTTKKFVCYEIIGIHVPFIT